MIITRARVEDLADIVDIERMGFDESGQWSEHSWRQELEAADRCVLACREPASGTVTGVATFQAVADVADLNRVIVHPEARGQGIGRALLHAGMEWAEAIGAEQVLLEVEQDNEIAMALYCRMGFVPLAHRANYYGTGRHAVVMAKDLAKPDPWRVNASG